MAKSLRNKVVSREVWIKARKALLAKEKAFTRERDRLAAARRALPWEEVSKEYFFDRPVGHLNQRDVAMVAVSRAQYAKLAAYQKRMGWSFKWLSSFGSDFNFDFNVSFTPEEMKKKKAFYNFAVQNPDAGEREGVSVFFKDAK